MRRGDPRTLDEKISDLLAEEWSIQEIADELDVTYGQVRQRYHVICAKLGEKPDADRS